MAASKSISAPNFGDDDAETPKISNFEAGNGDDSMKIANTISIEVPDSADDDIDHAKISNFEVAASYNWLDEYTPTILVPGIPPVWSPPTNAPFLGPDFGPRWVDQNADRNPTSPLAALICAVQSSKPEFDFAAIDVITDRRPIRKLYGFITGDWKPFKFGVTILGNTALFSRMEDRTREGQGTKGYRQAFETAYLKIALSGKDSTSHHRIVRYIFGGMSFLVRSSIDAYLRDRVEKLDLANGNKQASPDELTDFVKAVSLEEPTPSLSVFTARVVVIPGGRPIPHAATLELSTRGKWAPKTDLLARKLPDLWISQSANFMEAYHGHPRFGPHVNRGKWRGTLPSSSSNGQPRPTGKSGCTTISPKSNTKSHPSGNGRGMPHLISSSDSDLKGKWRGFVQPSKSDRKPQQTGNWKGVNNPPQSNSYKQLTKFTDIKIKPLAIELVTWEAANAKSLGGLVVVIKKVIEATKKLQGPCIVSCDGKKGGILEIRWAMEGEVVGLPQELEDLFIAVRG